MCFARSVSTAPLSTAQIFGKFLFGHRANPAAIQEAIDAGHDINAADNADRWTILHYALVALTPPNTEVVRVLLKNGAHINAAENRGWTPLHFAARSAPLEVIAMLLEAGADPNIPRLDGITPLHESILRKQVDLDIVRAMTARGGKPTEAMMNFARARVSPIRLTLLALLGDAA